MSNEAESKVTASSFALKLLAYGEEERRRVARELHDDISQRLAMLADDADSLRREVKMADPDIRRRLDSLVKQAKGLADDLRNISHVLHPAILDDLGLAVALRALVRHFGERTGLAAKFEEFNVPSRLPADLTTALYRIAQEGLRNISKHAGDTPVTVTLRGHSGELDLTILDSGSGFDPASAAGLGLNSMRERAYLAGGTFNLTSDKGQGTCIKVCVPL